LAASQLSSLGECLGLGILEVVGGAEEAQRYSFYNGNHCSVKPRYPSSATIKMYNKSEVTRINLMPPTGHLELHLNFGSRLLPLNEDCVGAEIPFSFKGHDCVICFPNFESGSRDGDFVPTFANTNVRMKWLEKSKENSSFGEARSWDSGRNAVRNFWCNQIIIRSSSTMTPDIAMDMRTGIHEWLDNFLKWVEVIEYVDLSWEYIQIDAEEQPEAYLVLDGSESTRIEVNGESSPTIRINWPTWLNRQSVELAAQKASMSGSPPPHFILLISSLNHQGKRKYRESILDAATAVEVCLALLLDTRMTGTNPIQQELIRKKYQGINNLSTALKKCGEVIDTQLMKDSISDPRNSCIHRGTIITEPTARIALKFAKDFVYSKDKNSIS
jgi:hypothetical protein